MAKNVKLMGLVGIYNGVNVYKTNRNNIAAGNWSKDYYYIIEDDGYMLFTKGKVVGYLDKASEKVILFSAPKDYPRGKAEEEMMKKVVAEEDEFLRIACDTEWTKKYLSEV